MQGIRLGNSQPSRVAEIEIAELRGFFCRGKIPVEISEALLHRV
jgi:hypothetical protein